MLPSSRLGLGRTPLELCFAPLRRRNKPLMHTRDLAAQRRLLALELRPLGLLLRGPLASLLEVLLGERLQLEA